MSLQGSHQVFLLCILHFYTHNKGKFYTCYHSIDCQNCLTFKLTFLNVTGLLQKDLSQIERTLYINFCSTVSFTLQQYHLKQFCIYVQALYTIYSFKPVLCLTHPPEFESVHTTFPIFPVAGLHDHGCQWWLPLVVWKLLGRDDVCAIQDMRTG